MEFLQTFVERLLHSSVLSTVMLLMRVVTPILVLLVVWRSYTSFKKGQRRKAPVVLLEDAETGTRFPVLYWENSIGRARSCDIQIPDSAVSRDHAVLMRREEGWMVADTGSRGGTFVGGAPIDGPTLIEVGDSFTVGATRLTLRTAKNLPEKRRRVFTGFLKTAASPVSLMLLVTVVQISMTLQLMLGTGEFRLYPVWPFAVLFVSGWGLYFFSRRILRRVSFEIETVALLLSSVGILLLAGEGLDAVTTQCAAFVLGIFLFCFLVWFIGDLERVQRMRVFAGAAALVLFAVNLVFGTELQGSKNWIIIGPVSVQPSELIKIAFVFVGASTLDRLQTKKNITAFIAFSAACLACLFVMRDFGTALIFFATFLIIAFMRSGSFRTIFLILAAAVFGVFLILQFRPYVAQRFMGWGHVWEHAQESLGYQQTRTLTYIASGGLFGMGLGNGVLKYIAAADSDLVFGMLSEEQGLAMSLTVLFALVLFVLYARSDVTRSRSTFYAIAACAASGMLLFQAALNVFGPTDVLPLTGVTLPFISAGGTSILSTWGLMAFLKASDERTYGARRAGRHAHGAPDRSAERRRAEADYEPFAEPAPEPRRRPVHVHLPEEALDPRDGDDGEAPQEGGVYR